jgi:ArsR family transcriptional regulator
MVVLSECRTEAVASMMVDTLSFVSMIVNTTSAPRLRSCCGSPAGDALTEEEADTLAAALKALADPVRLRLVSIIATSPTAEVCACDLPAWLDRSQPTVSHHLSILVEAGVLAREQRGKWAWFRLRSERLAELSAVLSPA